MDLRKIYGGTPTGSESRCQTCVHGMVVKGFAESERFCMCAAQYPAIRIPFVVAECTHYRHRMVPLVEDLEEIAVDLTVARAPRHAGFNRAGNGAQSLQDKQDEDT